MTLLAAFQALLYRYSRQRDICVGTPIAGRHRLQTEELIGFFINTLVMRADFDRGLDFATLLARVKETAIEAYAHQDLPFEKLVTELQLERNLAHTPLFQVVFVLQNVAVEKAEIGGLRIAPYGGPAATAKFDLTLQMSESPAGMVGTAEYRTDLFDASTIRRLLGHFERLLAEVVRGPCRRLDEIVLLSQAERHHLLTEWCGGEMELEPEVTLPELFEAQVALAPERVALVCGKEQLTYCELNERANRLAHHLTALGVTAGMPVVLALERSAELVVGILGILKAGGGYVPVDPSYPEARLRFLLEEALREVSVPLLVTSEAVQGPFRKLQDEITSLREPLRVIRLDDRHEMVRNSGASPRRAAAPDLAYVIFTSGSTGQPKGVGVGHRHVVRLLEATRPWFEFGPDDVWTLFHSSAFDFSVWELWGALAYGGRLVVVPYWVSRSPEAFYDLLGRERVSVLNQTPSAFRQLIAEEEPAGPPRDLALRAVIFGGEALELRSLGPWLARHGDRRPRLINMYGITETTVHVTYRPLAAADISAGNGSVIGRPIADLEIYLLDGALQPVPIGVAGEILVGGGGVTGGYRYRPALTAERFVPHPLARRPGKRLYRSGDLARRLRDGDVEYLRRIDHQVQVRGFRIEPGEIEAVLCSHPAVRAAVVLVRPDSAAPDLPGEPRLTAYVVAMAEPPAENELRAFAQARLPLYMVPTRFVFRESLPVTPHGKIDRAALPAPDANRPRDAATFVAPQGAVEERLAEIWRIVLKMERVGAQDNFFDLGGDSILSIQIVSQARKANIAITPRQIFEHQTIAELAVVAGTVDVVAAEQGPVTGSLPLTPIQRWFFDHEPPAPHHFNQSLLLALRRELEPAVLAAAASHLVSHHDALRLRFSRGEAGWESRLAGLDGPTEFAEIDLSALATVAQKVAQEVAATALQRSLDLSRGPLARFVRFLCRPARRDRLLIIVHHLAVDGVSWRILLEDLQELCDRLQKGASPELPSKTTSYKQWAERLEEFANSPELAAELDGWLAVAGAEIAPLPIDHPEGRNIEASAQRLSVSLDAEETEALLREVPKAYQTQVPEVLLTALAQALAQWTQTSALVIGIEGHGREEIAADMDLSRTVGWFTSMYPVMLQVTPGDDSGSILKNVKETLRRLPRKGLGYGVLRYLHPQAAVADKLRALPRAQVVFNYHGQLDQALPHSSLFAAASEPAGASHSPRALRRYLLDVTASIAGGRLSVAWTFSHQVHRRSTIEHLAQGFLAHLRTLIAHCRTLEESQYTPSDFADVDLTQEQLDRVLAEIDLK